MRWNASSSRGMWGNQGPGWNESGWLTTVTLADYKVPGIADVPPQIVPIVLEDPDPTHPAGAKGIGRHAPPLAEAEVNRMPELRINPDKVCGFLQAARESAAKIPATTGDRTTWLLSRPTGTTHAVKIRLEPSERSAEQRVHPGHDWFYVLSGRVRLRLGEREILVAAGEAAEFETMTPHALEAHGEPAEVVMIFDRDGQLAHARTDDEVDPAPDR